MKSKIIEIGNSKGIRIPKGMLAELNLKNEVTLETKHDTLIIRAVQKPRQGWAEKFQTMAANKDDKLLDDVTTSDWDEKEWEWK